MSSVFRKSSVLSGFPAVIRMDLSIIRFINLSLKKMSLSHSLPGPLWPLVFSPSRSPWSGSSVRTAGARSRWRRKSSPSSSSRNSAWAATSWSFRSRWGSTRGGGGGGGGGLKVEVGVEKLSWALIGLYLQLQYSGFCKKPVEFLLCCCFFSFSQSGLHEYLDHLLKCFVWVWSEWATVQWAQAIYQFNGSALWMLNPRPWHCPLCCTHWALEMEVIAQWEQEVMERLEGRFTHFHLLKMDREIDPCFFCVVAFPFFSKFFFSCLPPADSLPPRGGHCSR